MSNLSLSDKDIKRFNSKIVKDTLTGCWIFNVADHNSYGHKRIWINGRYEGAHRIAYFLRHGIEPDGDVAHSCDNPACVNPDHLFATTHQGNQLDKVVKGRHAYGSRNGSAKLTEEQVVEIRELYRAGGRKMSCSVLAKMYNVSSSTIHNVVSEKSTFWRNV